MMKMPTDNSSYGAHGLPFGTFNSGAVSDWATNAQGLSHGSTCKCQAWDLDSDDW